ncbi:GNAT family N-acetyltransferase [Streptosporangium sp. NPDC023615]|uniref:GNAT family N-acetyltransferase n=1 Tax=Streptosporangium sp. NPDC023615 TaxID=3154794 RepID=UPI003438483A
MRNVVARPYGGPSDLRRMQDLVRAAWHAAALPHVGGLAWSRFQHVDREAEWPTMLWERGGETLAWGWAMPPGELELFVHPEHPGLADEVLDWFHGAGSGGGAGAGSGGGAAGETAVTILTGEERLAAALARHGYRPGPADAPFQVRMSRDLSDLPEPEVPPGFTMRHVRGEEDVAERVAVHRSAFAPSSVTEESYRNVMRAWPYRPELDCVVEAPDGRLVAYCLIWPDALNGVGELEPVGTHRDFRRLGLARAVCLYALHRLGRTGAAGAIVQPRGDAGYPVPARLYEAIGFRTVDRTVRHTRPVEAPRP